MSSQCGGCDAKWGGLNRCHCAAEGCHRTFSGITLFDAHRSHGKCRNPKNLKKEDGTPWMKLEDGIWRGFEDQPLDMARAAKKVKSEREG